MNILVMGIGNLLLQDEGAGVRAVEEFERRFETPECVELLDGGTSGIELLRYIQGRDVLILIDVVRNGDPWGTLTRFEGADVPALFQKKISPHQLGISDLLATSRLTDSMPEKVVLFGIEPKSIDTGLELTAEIAGNIPRLTELVADELRALGLRIEPREYKRESSGDTAGFDFISAL
jgi:hydrogenase maturation protease